MRDLLAPVGWIVFDCDHVVMPCPVQRVVTASLKVCSTQRSFREGAGAARAARAAVASGELCSWAVGGGGDLNSAASGTPTSEA